MTDKKRMGRPPLHRQEMHDVLERNFRELAIRNLEVPSMGAVIAVAGSKGSGELPVSDRTAFRAYQDITGFEVTNGGNLSGQKFGVLPAVVVANVVYIPEVLNPNTDNLTMSYPSGIIGSVVVHNL